jgi:hypothetical protein
MRQDYVRYLFAEGVSSGDIALAVSFGSLDELDRLFRSALGCGADG